MTLARQVDRLIACFRVVAVGAGATALVAQLAHCGSRGGASSGGADASIASDGSSADDGALATDGSDAASDAIADRASDGFDAAACFGTVHVPDAYGPDGEELCDFTVPCGLASSGLTVVGCAVVPAAFDGAPQDPNKVGFPTCYLVDADGCDAGPTPLDAAMAFECIGCPGGGGRRPRGWKRGARAAAASAPNAIARYFAELAALEGASVGAFVMLARSLESLGAPSELREAAKESARDELRHARVMRAMARRHGCATIPGKTQRISFRTAYALATHNAAEGCVREAHGALLAAWQATHARDADVRAAMASVAGDELRHAALSLAIDDWVSSRLGVRARERIVRAKRREVGRLATQAMAPIASPLRSALGLPASGRARAIIERMAGELSLA